MGNRTYGSVLLGRIATEDDRKPSPCIRYFIDANGNRITEPEEFIPPENAGWVEPEEFWNKETEEESMPRGQKAEMPTKEQLTADVLTMTNQQIAKKYGYGKTLIETWIREYGIQRRNLALPEGEKKLETTPYQTDTDEIEAVDDVPFADDLTPEEQQWVDEHYGEMREAVAEEERQIVNEAEREEPGIIGQVYELIEKCIGESEPEPRKDPVWDEECQGEAGADLAKKLEELEAVKFKIENPVSYWKIMNSRKLAESEAIEREHRNTMAEPSDPDEPDWRHIEAEIRALFELKHNRMVGEFKGRLRKIMEEVGA